MTNAVVSMLWCRKRVMLVLGIITRPQRAFGLSMQENSSGQLKQSNVVQDYGWFYYFYRSKREQGVLSGRIAAAYFAIALRRVN